MAVVYTGALFGEAQLAVCDWLFLCFTFWIPAHDSDLGFVCLVATKPLEHPCLMASLFN